MWIAKHRWVSNPKTETTYEVCGGDSLLAASDLAAALNVHEATGLTPSQLQARVAELEQILRVIDGKVGAGIVVLPEADADRVRRVVGQ